MGPLPKKEKKEEEGKAQVRVVAVKREHHFWNCCLKDKKILPSQENETRLKLFFVESPYQMCDCIELNFALIVFIHEETDKEAKRDKEARILYIFLIKVSDGYALDVGPLAIRFGNQKLRY